MVVMVVVIVIVVIVVIHGGNNGVRGDGCLFVSLNNLSGTV